MKTKILIIVLIFCSRLLFGQDVIIKKTGDEIKGTVTEVTSLEIKYKTTANPNVTYSILKSEVFMIQYQNGTKDVFTETNTTTPTTTTIIPNNNKNTTTTVTNNANTANSQTDCNQAVLDAKNTYKPSGAFWGTYLTAFLLDPVLGLIPAISCSSTKPKMENLDIPFTYATNDAYKNCFQEKAWKIKKGQIWVGYGIGSVASIAISIIIISSLSSY